MQIGRLTAEPIFKKGIVSFKWLIIKQLKLNKQFERFNDKRTEGFISDSSYTKFTYVSDNNISGIKLIAIFNYQIKQKLIIFVLFLDRLSINSSGYEIRNYLMNQ